MKTKKRYTTTDEILDDMDKLRIKAVKSLEEADQQEALAKKLIGTCEEYRSDELFDQAAKLRRSSSRILEFKLKDLGDKLSTLRTPVMGAITEDPSIPA